MALVIEHHEALEVDLLRQGVDLLDVWRGALSWRRLELLIRYLDPKTSVLVRETNPDLAFMASWSVAEHQRADHYNLLAELLPLVRKQMTRPYPRPDEQLRDREARRARDEFFAAQAERNRARDKAEGRAS